MKNIDFENAVKQWLAEFSDCVRNQDFERGLSLFDKDAVGFGTWTDRMNGLELLYQKQWSNVWPNTSGFQFDAESISIWFDSAEEPTQCTVGVLWTSRGLKEDGTVFDRAGRSTIVLGCSGGKWIALHTHFSFNPEGNLGG